MKETDLVKAGKLGRGEGENFHKILFLMTAGLNAHRTHTHAHTQNKQKP